MRIKKICCSDNTVCSYNDSGSEWVVYDEHGEMSEQRFDQGSWTQKDAMEFYCRMLEQFMDHT